MVKTISAFLLAIFLFFGQYSNYNILAQSGGGGSEVFLPLEQVENSSTDDEFLPLDSSNNTKESKDEFESFKSCGDSCNACPEKSEENKSWINWQRLQWPLAGLLATILAGIFIRFSGTRHLKSIMLIGSAIAFGFYNGACPCPISSFSHTFIGITGGNSNWESMIWFLGLIPITYIFGKVWCGWICHLGALQEFIFLHNKFEFLKGAKSQKIMRILRYVLTAALIIQVIWTQTYLFDKIDPFKVAYNLGFNASLTGWILLGLLLLTSAFIYRPFCKAACPIGLVLGLVNKIPGASVIGTNGKCNGCRTCSSSCDMNAIVRYDTYSILDNKDCILCGECLDSCKKDALAFFRKGKVHNDKIECRRETKPTSVDDFFDVEFPNK